MSRRDQQQREPDARLGHQRSTREHTIPREPVHRLDETQLRTLRVVGSFRIINREDLGEKDTKRLIRDGYIKRHTLASRRTGKPLEILALTTKGRDELAHHAGKGEAQQYWQGAVKPREMEHDMAIYPACQKEIKAIESAGGKIDRIVLDFEFKAKINSRMNKREGPKLDVRRKEIAAEFELPLHDGKVMLPDARIEYTDAEGREQHKDVEVVTAAYKGRMMSGKRASGFSLHSVKSVNASRAAVRDDHRLSLWE